MDRHDDIDEVRPADRPRVLEVWEASVRATHDFLAPGYVDELRPLVRDTYLDLVDLACLRDDDGSVVGFVGTAAGKIEMLFVDPAHFRRGVGRRLLRYAVRSVGAVLVDVNEQNRGAVQFYLRGGFEVCGRSPLDGQGRPYPLLHMRLAVPGGGL